MAQDKAHKDDKCDDEYNRETNDEHNGSSDAAIAIDASVWDADGVTIAGNPSTEPHCYIRGVKTGKSYLPDDALRR